jgi:hypothetical protein
MSSRLTELQATDVIFDNYGKVQNQAANQHMIGNMAFS